MAIHGKNGHGIIVREVSQVLQPGFFTTPFDVVGDEYDVEQYRKGLDLASTYDEIHIAINWVWSADRENGCVSSCEKLGFHRSTAALVRGWLDGGIPIFLHQWADECEC